MSVRKTNFTYSLVAHRLTSCALLYNSGWKLQLI